MKNLKNVKITGNAESAMVIKGSLAPQERVYQLLLEDSVQINKQRKLIIDGLFEKGEGATAEQLWLHIHKTKKISISTVYKTLNILCQHGIVYKFYDQINQAFYTVDQAFIF